MTNVIKFKNRTVEKIGAEINSLKEDFEKFDEVECIYYNFQRGKKGKPVIVLTIVISEKYHSSVLQDIKHYNDGKTKINGIRIHIDGDQAKQYAKISVKPSEIRREKQLKEGTIIYDGNGKYTYIKEKENYDRFTNITQVTTQPPLEDVINEMSRRNQELAIRQTFKTS